MWRKELSLVLGRALAIFAIALTLESGALAAAREKVLHSFSTNGKDGILPFARLTFDKKGNLYGTTEWGGGNGSGEGTVFTLTPSSGGSWKETVLHSFSGDDGAAVYAGLIFDSAGNLYGTTSRGGAHGAGLVFQLTPRHQCWKETVLHSFALDSDGNEPFAAVVLDKAGNLYGTTAGGGAYEGGIAFMLTPSSGGWTENVLHNFGANGRDGVEPNVGLIFDTAGNLYGTTTWGGDYSKSCSIGCGTVFNLKPGSDGVWKEHVLHRFNWSSGGSDGTAPYAGLVFDRSGNLYGTTAGGGIYNHGTVFKLTRCPGGGWTETVLYAFKENLNGNSPFAGLVLDKAGNLYGTTAWGGIGSCEGGCGVVFKLTPGAQGIWTYSVLHRFTGNRDGARPFAGLIFDKKGKLYGTTAYGGKDNAGVVFEVTP
ncbi:MAG TPA: choice-of-anchor tandem repeat GloVer-containing protein [Terriglobales bacterium]|nr:choice-of-anchor tandem repeat GloVer-containing protein [Terriglobales bacterium]